MKVVKIGGLTIHLDRVVYIKECYAAETLYGRSVQKGLAEGWMEVYFEHPGHVLRLEREAAESLRRHLAEECGVRVLSTREEDDFDEMVVRAIDLPVARTA
jgi:hypothetical protein